jgi:hypothetical protein
VKAIATQKAVSTQPAVPASRVSVSGKQEDEQPSSHSAGENKRKSASPHPSNVKAARVSTAESNTDSSVPQSINIKPVQKTTVVATAASVVHRPAGEAKAVAKSSGSSKSSKSGGGDDLVDTDDMMALLRKHNQKFVPQPTYVPMQHSVRDVRAWERSSGKVWAQLNPEQKEQANKEITEMVRAKAK